MAPGAAWQSIPFGGVGIRSMELYIYICHFSFCRGDLRCPWNMEWYGEWLGGKGWVEGGRWKVEDGLQKCCKWLANTMLNIGNAASIANRMALGAAWQSIPFGGVGIRSMELYIYVISLSVEVI